MTANTNQISRRTFIKFSLLSLAGLAWNRLEDDSIFAPIESPQLDEPYPKIIHSIPTALPYFAMTIDDGFDAEALVEILDMMEERNYTATFFMVGRYSLRAERAYPGIMKRLAENGNELAYHTMTHERPEGGWQLDYLIGDHTTWLNHHKEMLGDELFAQAVKPYARAPWDNFSKPFLRMCEAKKLIPFSWSNDPGSYNRGQVVVPGDIFLLHVRDADLSYFKDFGPDSPVRPVKLSYLAEAQARYQAVMQNAPIR